MRGKHIFTKAMAICLAAVMCLSLLGGIMPAANAVNASTLSAGTVKINTGVRIYITTFDKNGAAVTGRFIPTDVNGVEVTPYIVEDANGGGTTYLPIRAVSKIFGANINWDDTLKSIFIEKPDAVTVTNPSTGVDKEAVYTSSVVSAYTGANVYVDSYEFIPTDVNGNKVNVLLVEDVNGGGTTYLPIRAMTQIFLGNATGASDCIVWNQANRTVTITAPKASTSGDTDDIDDDDDTDTTVSYPTIFIHGLMGWGYEDGIAGVLNYWGMTSGNMMDYLTDKGYKVYDASVGPVSSAWDRCCELYAQLTGTKVDYGEAHVEKVNAEQAKLGGELTHNRYGRDYTGKPLISKWDSTNKINLVGHSFGGPTGQLFITLLHDGAAAEIAYAKAKYGNNWKANINPLFLGGKGNYVNSFTSLAGVLNGTTFISTCDDETTILSGMALGLANAMGVTKLGSIYDFQLEQFGLTKIPGSSDEAYLSKIKQSKFLEGTDNAFYDLSIAGCSELNKTCKTYSDVYYFSYAGNQTRASITGNYLPKITMNPLFLTFSTKMGSYTNKDELILNPNGTVSKDGYKYSTITDAWKPNDGMVNTISARYPFGAANAAMTNKNLVRGLWYWKDVDMDHLDLVGGLGLPALLTTRQFYLELMGNIQATYK